MWVHLQDVRPGFLHDMRQAEQVKQSFSHKTFPLTVATQGLTDLGFVSFPRYLLTHKIQFNKPEFLRTVFNVNVRIYTHL